jgi:hypothetical protein
MNLLFMRGNHRMAACVDGQNEPFAVNIPILAFADNGILIRGKDRAFAPRDYIVSVKPEISLDSPFPEFGCMDFSAPMTLNAPKSTVLCFISF